jgi:hypothetical protein
MIIRCVCEIMQIFGMLQTPVVCGPCTLLMPDTTVVSTSTQLSRTRNTRFEAEPVVFGCATKDQEDQAASIYWLAHARPS